MKFELTEDQRKAIQRLGRALKKCKDSNVVFYCVLSEIEAFDGNVVECVSFEKSDYCMEDPENHGESVNTHGYDLGAYADDPGMHYIQLADR